MAFHFTPDEFNFGAIFPGDSTRQTFLSTALVTEAQVTAKIIDDTANKFHLIALQSVKEVVSFEPPPGDGPISRGPPRLIKTTTLEVTGQSGGTALSIPAGQMVQVDVEFDGSVAAGQSTAAPFTGSVEINGGAWTASIPLVGIIGEVQLTLPNSNFSILQNHTIELQVGVVLIAGPPTIVSLLPFTGTLNTGLTVTAFPSSVQVQLGQPATASLTISAAQTAPIATTQYWIGVWAFGGIGSGTSSSATSSFGFTISVKQLRLQLSPIPAKYASLGGALGFLGFPTSPEGFCSDLVGQFQRYQNGAIYWSGVPGSPAFEIHDPVLTKWRQFNPNNPNDLEADFSTLPLNGLGYPVSDVTTAGQGLKSAFQNAGIYWSQDTGPHTVSLQVYDEYRNRQGEVTGVLGFPTADSIVANDANEDPYVFGDFENGSIFGRPRPGGPIGLVGAGLDPAKQVISPSVALDQSASAISKAVADYNVNAKHKVGMQGGPFFQNPMLTGYTYDAATGIAFNRQYRLQQNLFVDASIFPDIKITVTFNLLLRWGPQVGPDFFPSDPNPHFSQSITPQVNTVAVNIDTRGDPGISQSDVDAAKAQLITAASGAAPPPMVLKIWPLIPLTAKVLITGAGVLLADDVFPGEGTLVVLILPPLEP